MISDEALLEKVKTCYHDAETASGAWRSEARELFDAYAGEQWDEVDRWKLQEQLRPVVTFNLSGKFIDSVAGLQINNRQEHKFLPREPGDTVGNEFVGEVAKWVRDECDAEDEESDAFTDLLICGIGCIEWHLSFDDNPMGEIVGERRDPLLQYWDPNATKRNVRDTRWRMRIKLMTKDEIVERWGEDAFDNITGTMGLDVADFDQDLYVVSNEKYLHDAVEAPYRKTTPVAHIEWFERGDLWEVQTQYGTRRFTQSQYRKISETFKRNGILYSAKKIRAKKFYTAFVAGDEVLAKGESPYQNGFTQHILTGKRDRNANSWFGLGRMLKDPQRWVNKFFSNILHILNANSKGGVMVEEGAVADPQKFEDSWAAPDGVVYVEDGAISEGRIQEKGMSRYPTGMDKLMQFAIEAMPQTTGINLELLGMQDKVQAGVVEAQRKQSAMAVIAWAFDAMRRYYKDSGRQLVYYIREYIADGRLARVVSQGKQQYIPIFKQQFAAEFDVVVDEAPNSPNMKERVWAVLEVMLPNLLKMGASGILPEALEYSPLPAELVEKIKQGMNSPEMKEAQEAQKEDREAKTEETRSKTVFNLARAREAAADAGKTAAGG